MTFSDPRPIDVDQALPSTTVDVIPDKKDWFCGIQ